VSDLVEVERELTPTVDVLPCEGGDDFFCRGGKCVLPPIAIRGGEEGPCVFVLRPPVGLFPEFPGMKDGHLDLHRTGEIHLLADDGADALEDSSPQVIDGVDTGSSLGHETRPDHELVCSGVCVFGIFPPGGREFADEHGVLLGCVPI